METGVLIRASIQGQYESIDIGDERLDNKQLVHWLRSRGGVNPWCENLLLSFLGREQNAHEIQYIVEDAAVAYISGVKCLEIVAHEGKIVILISERRPDQGLRDDCTSIDIPTTDARVYNGAMHLIKSIQVHHEESVNKS